MCIGHQREGTIGARRDDKAIRGLKRSVSMGMLKGGREKSRSRMKKVEERKEKEVDRQ